MGSNLTSSNNRQVADLPTPLDGFGGFSQAGSESNDRTDSVAQARRYLSAVKRFRWLVAGITMVGTVVGILSTRFLKPEYHAQSTIWIEQEGSGNGNPIASGNLLSSKAWVELLKSFVILDNVVRSQQLFLVTKEEDRELFAGLQVGDSLYPGSFSLRVDSEGRSWEVRAATGLFERGLVGDSVGRKFGLLWRPRPSVLTAELGVEFVIEVPRDAALKLRDQLDLSISRNGNFLPIELTGPRPDQVARVLNAIVDRFTEVAAQLKRRKLTERTTILEDQLSRSADNLANTEISLEAFRVQTITLPSDPGTPIAPGIEQTRGPVFQGFFDKQVQREALRFDQDALTAAMERRSEAGELSIAALEVIPAVQQSSEMSSALSELSSKQAELRALRTQYTDQMPEVQRLIADIENSETNIIPGLVVGLTQQLAQRRSDLEVTIDNAAQQLEEIPPRMIEEARLRRNVTIAETLFANLQQRYEEARLGSLSAQPDVRVLDRAVPPQLPFKNRTPVIMFMGFFASLGAGIGVALLLDILDPRIRYPDQVTRELGLPILAAIPGASSGKAGVNGRDTMRVLEAIRGARMNLTYASGGTWPMAITVTSPGPGDGKSFFSANLALSFAESGNATLLIDGDMRRGGLHKSLGLQRRPGLSDYLSGSASVTDVIQHSEFGTLDFIGRGRSNPAAPELVGSPVFSALLDDVKGRYKVIIVDSPPLGAGVDAFSLGTQTGQMCLVIRRGVTSKEMAGAKLDMLARLPVTVLGAILNDVAENDSSYQAYSYYVDGYEAEALEADEPEALIGSGTGG